MITVITDFMYIKNDWERLYHSGNYSVFQSYEYNLISWNYFLGNEKLYLIVYKNNDEEVQIILPTYIDSKGCLKFINDVETDICDMIYDSHISLYDSIKEICEFIISRKEIKRISLDNLRTSSPLLSYIKVFCSKSYIYSSNEFTYLDCVKNDEPISTFTHLTSDKRKKLKKIIKQTETFEFEIYSRQNNDDFPETEIKNVSTYMVENNMRSESYLNKSFWDFTKASYEAGILEVGILFDENKVPISVGFVFINSTISIRWVILYKEAKFNLWNNVRYINSKAKIYSYQNNFGRGGYDYKMGNFKPNVALLYKIEIPVSFWSYLEVPWAIEMSVVKRLLRHSKLHKYITSVKTIIRNKLCR